MEEWPIELHTDNYSTWVKEIERTPEKVNIYHQLTAAGKLLLERLTQKHPTHPPLPMPYFNFQS